MSAPKGQLHLFELTLNDEVSHALRLLPPEVRARLIEYADAVDRAALTMEYERESKKALVELAIALRNEIRKE